MVEVVFAALALLVGPLDDAPRRGVVTGHGDAYGRAVPQSDLALHQPFAETRAADDDAPIPILHGTGDDLARRSRIFVDQHHQPSPEVVAVDRRAERHGRHGTPLGRDDQGTARQEETGHLDRLVEQPAAVPAQVEDQRPGFPELAVRLAELGHRRAAEAVDLDVSHAVGGHVGGIHGVERNLVPHDHEVERFRFALAHDVDLDLRAGLSAQVLGDVRLLETHGIQRVYAHDTVVGLHPDALGRAPDDRIDHDDRVAQDVEFDADAAELPFEALLHALHLVGPDIGRMGVEVFEHPGDGALDQRLHVHLVDVQPVQVTVNLRQLLQLPHSPGILRRKRQD